MCPNKRKHPYFCRMRFPFQFLHSALPPRRRAWPPCPTLTRGPPCCSPRAWAGSAGWPTRSSRMSWWDIAKLVYCPPSRGLKRDPNYFIRSVPRLSVCKLQYAVWKLAYRVLMTWRAALGPQSHRGPWPGTTRPPQEQVAQRRRKEWGQF